MRVLQRRRVGSLLGSLLGLSRSEALSLGTKTSQSDSDHPVPSESASHVAVPAVAIAACSPTMRLKLIRHRETCAVTVTTCISGSDRLVWLPLYMPGL